MLGGREFSTPSVSYDKLIATQTPETRYLTTNNIKMPFTGMLLTHCLDANRLKHLFPDDELVFIKTDYMKSLRRGWCLEKDRAWKSVDYAQLKYKDINSAYDMLCWHKKYYEQYPNNLDQIADTVIDVAVEDSEFAKVMREELDNHHNDIFDLAWDVLMEHGFNAPIIDIFDHLY
jgi:hypothetical protein